MALSTIDIYLQATIAIIIIVNPIDPVKIVIFNSVIARQGLDRRRAATRVALTVAAILGVSALVGRDLLNLMGINLGAFGIIGGLIVAGMGLEMLYSGGTSRVQGASEASQQPPEDDGLIMPVATPLMAGPGAITTVITVSSFRADGSTLIAAVVAVALVAVLVFAGFAYLGAAFDRLKPAAAAMLARVGGLLLATIGAQLVLGGIRTFYGS
ncbi:MAG TPA: MarC family protein [Streptosporangiaceae bacterium]|nr:MarC family protein [Streptosporangiaceae bacterium]